MVHVHHARIRSASFHHDAIKLPLNQEARVEAQCNRMMMTMALMMIMIMMSD